LFSSYRAQSQSLANQETFVEKKGSREHLPNLTKHTYKNIKAPFVYIGLIITGINKCNEKIMIATIRDPDLFRGQKLI
jgi:hypothetical protein